jgi:LuxR family maltose regulon positive regulatory protein
MGRHDEAMEDAKARIERYYSPQPSAFASRVLWGEHIILGVAGYLNAPYTDRYDFYEMFEKADYYYRLSPDIVTGPIARVNLDAWVSKVGTARKGAMEEYIEAVSKVIPHSVNIMSGLLYGMDDLARGELYFYKGDFRNAAKSLNQALGKARERNQDEIRNRALFYLLRIGVAQGNYEETQRLFKDLEAQLEIKEYHSRFTTFDIVSGWYFSIMRQPQLIANWMLGDFSEGSLGAFEEAFSNFVKAKLFYASKRYHELLAFLEDEHVLDAVLFGRLEMLVLEAVCLYQLKNRDGALAAFRKAYEAAESNELLMPFIEMGNDMRTLTRVAMRENGCGIPREWLEALNRKSATYAKRLNLVASEYKKANNLGKDVRLSEREIEVLYDVYHGLTSSEIAVSHNLSINTIKMVLSSIYSKLGAENIADVTRIALEHKLIK